MTADISSTPQPNLFAIPPPDLSGTGFGNLVVDNKGIPLGEKTSSETVVAMLGYSSKDTMGPDLQDVIEMANMLNLGLSIPRGTVEQSILVYLDTLDPSTPGLPPIKTLLVLLQRDLIAGKLGNTQLQEQSDTQSQATAQETATDNKNVKETKTSQTATDQTTDDTLAAPTTLQLNGQPPLAGEANVKINTAPGGPTSAPANASTEDQLNAIKNNIDLFSDTKVDPKFGKVAVGVGKTSGGNPFLAGNAYVAFLIAFMEMQRIQMKSKVVENNIELVSMNLTWTLAQETADAIMEIAQQNFAVHIAQACMAGVSLAMTIGGAIFALKGSGLMKSAKMDAEGNIMKDAKGNPIMVHQQHAGYMRMSEIMTGAGMSMSQMGTGVAQAATELNTAQLEGRKEMLQAIRQLIQMQLQKATEAIKSQEDMITQELQTLIQIGNSLEQAIAAALRK